MASIDRPTPDDQQLKSGGRGQPAKHVQARQRHGLCFVLDLAARHACGRDGGTSSVVTVVLVALLAGRGVEGGRVGRGRMRGRRLEVFKGPAEEEDASELALEMVLPPLHPADVHKLRGRERITAAEPLSLRHAVHDKLEDTGVSAPPSDHSVPAAVVIAALGDDRGVRASDAEHEPSISDAHAEVRRFIPGGSAAHWCGDARALRVHEPTASKPLAICLASR
mmetsp:Transcript_128685/g.412232  ORF Transcript_128685/g.412232 Transcript_128685/m.412232 type:complete len:223 (+) Transcript_128685:510-1178(+)